MKSGKRHGTHTFGSNFPPSMVALRHYVLLVISSYSAELGIGSEYYGIRVQDPPIWTEVRRREKAEA